MNLLGKSVTELISLIKDKKLSSAEVYSYFQNRIKKYDNKIASYLTLASETSQTGVPLAFKDNISTKGLRTTASSKVLDTYISPYDATIVTNLKNKGFGILGKTNMDAWAHGASTETSDYGTTKNPWDHTRYPGGSSGGSAAAVSAYLAPGALGTDTGGSIRHPAAWCGVVGLKPTYGRSSRYGLIAMGSSFDCPGPITTNVEDNALILQNMAGKDSFDATTADKAVPDYLKDLKEKRKLKIGIAAEYLKGADKQIVEAFEKTAEVVKKMGHEVKNVTLLSPQYSISVQR
jgi:aspartyl-tRNA(Asn)/glutamyl-tRNA(Gln) amidotransferase subunit A